MRKPQLILLALQEEKRRWGVRHVAARVSRRLQTEQTIPP